MIQFLDNLLGSLPQGTTLGDTIFYNTFEVVRYTTACLLVLACVFFVGMLSIIIIKALIRGRKGV